MLTIFVESIWGLRSGDVVHSVSIKETWPQNADGHFNILLINIRYADQNFVFTSF